MDARSVVFGALLAGLVLVGVFLVLPFLTYILAALLLAFVLRPLHRRLTPVVGPQVSASSLVLLAVLLTVGPIVLLIRQLPTDATAVTGAIERLAEDGFLERLIGVEIPVESLLAGVPRQFAELFTAQAVNITGAIVHHLLGFFLLIFLVYYLLKDGPEFLAWVLETIPADPAVRDRLVEEAAATTSAVLKGHVLVAIAQGIIGGIGLLLVGLPNVLFWTMAMILLEFIPVLGVAGVLGPAVVYLFVVDRLLAAAFLAIYGLTAVAAVDDYLRALVVDRESSLHSAVVLVGVLGGVYVFGVMGLFFGPIALGLLGVMVELFDDLYSRS